MYNLTSTIEANFRDRINPNSKSNDFIVRVPPRILKKGTKLELSGAIVKEVSANNDNVIELSNQNVSKDKQYKSSWTSLEMRYYMNNNGYNSIAFPFIQTNFITRQAYTDPANNELWSGFSAYPNNTSYVHGNALPSVHITKISGPNVNTSIRAGPDFYDSEIYNLKPEVPFLRFDGSIVNPGGYYGNYPNQQYFDMYNELGHGANFNLNNLYGPTGIRSALKKNSPDGSKFTYITPGYKGPIQYDNSEQTNIPDMSIYTRNIEINLENDLMESPDELALLINERLQGAKFDATDNDVKVMSKFRQWNTDYIQTVANDDALYPKDSDKQVPNISSDTQINIPANFQNTQEHKVFGESFFVKNAEKWVYGNSYFKSNKKYTKLANNTFDRTFKGINPVIMRPHMNDFNTIYKNADDDHITAGTEYPATLSMSCITTLPLFEPFNFDDGTSYEWIFQGDKPPNLFDRTNSFLRFYETRANINGEKFVYGLTFYNVLEQQHFICEYNDINGNLGMNIYNATYAGSIFTQASTDIIFTINMEINEVLNNTELTLKYTGNGLSYIIKNFQLNQITSTPLKIKNDIAYNGLPYYAMEGTNGGGQYAKTGEDVDAIVDEYLCIPDKFVIPMNIQVYDPVNNLSIVLDRVRDFLKNNEIYDGIETDPVKMNADKNNWYCELDVGMADDFNNAYSNWLSSKGSSGGTNDITDYTIYDEQQNYSIYPNFYPDMMSNEQYDIQVPGVNGYNFRRPLTIYPISRYAKMGKNFTTNKNYLRVYSRFSNEIIDNITGSNVNMDVVRTNNTYYQRLHPLISIYNKDNIIYNYCQTNNIPIVGVKYYGSDVMSYGFINYKPTFNGHGKNSIDYKSESINFRQCFRICTGCNIGFDPASTTNPYMSAMNRDQTVRTNGNYISQEFYTTRSTTTIDVEQGTYSYGSVVDPIYSPIITDYVNNIWIGGSPQIEFDKSRMIFKNMFIPRKFNSNDALPGDPNIGSVICAFNDQTMFFSMLNCTIGSVPNFGVSPEQVSTRGAPGFFQTIRNKGLVDSLSGVGIENIYVRDELTNNKLPGEQGVYLCKINDDDTTENYDGSLLSLFGFDLRQFKPYFGKSYNRYSRHTYNSTGTDKYDGLNFFTLNALVNQNNSQNINIFGPNFLTTDPDPLPAPYYPQSMASQPELFNGYVGFQPMNIQVITDQMRSKDLPQKLQQSFYKITTSLPFGNNYITNNNNLSCASYFFRQYKNANFYFNYTTSDTVTLTEDYLLTSIRTKILNENNREAEHLGPACTVFYKIIEPKQLTELSEEDIKILENPKKQNQGLKFNDPITDIQQDELNSINAQLLTTFSGGGGGGGDIDNDHLGNIVIDENPEMIINFPQVAGDYRQGETKTEEILETPSKMQTFLSERINPSLVQSVIDAESEGRIGRPRMNRNEKEKVSNPLIDFSKGSKAQKMKTTYSGKERMDLRRQKEADEKQEADKKNESGARADPDPKTDTKDK
jgi:hypothetical protein